MPTSKDIENVLLVISRVMQHVESLVGDLQKASGEVYTAARDAYERVREEQAMEAPQALPLDIWIDTASGTWGVVTTDNELRRVPYAPETVELLNHMSDSEIITFGVENGYAL